MEEKKEVIVRIEVKGFEEEERDPFRTDLAKKIRGYPDLLTGKRISIFFSNGTFMDLLSEKRLRSVEICSSDSGLTATHIKKIIAEIEPNLEVYERSVRC
ncbi:MAG: hypothetical protein WC435_01965 [Candidatus Paceibacterota bacterium]